MNFKEDFDIGDKLTLTDQSGEGTMVATVVVIGYHLKDEFETFQLRILAITDALNCPEDQIPKEGNDYKVGRGVGVSSCYAGWSFERLS